MFFRETGCMPRITWSLKCQIERTWNLGNEKNGKSLKHRNHKQSKHTAVLWTPPPCVFANSVTQQVHTTNSPSLHHLFPSESLALLWGRTPRSRAETQGQILQMSKADTFTSVLPGCPPPMIDWQCSCQLLKSLWVGAFNLFTKMSSEGTKTVKSKWFRLC